MIDSQTDLDDEFNPSPPKPRPRSRRLRKVVLWLLGILAVIALLLFLGRWQVGRLGERQLNVVTNHLDAEEPGWKLDAILDEREKHQPPATENSGPIILDIADRIPKEWHSWQQSTEGNEFSVKYSDNHVPHADIIALAQKQAPTTLLVRTDAIRLRDKRSGFYPLVIPSDPLTATLPHLDKARQVARLLQYDGSLSALDRNPNRGINSARALLAVGRSISDEPLLISQLVRLTCANFAAQTAMQVLAWGEPTESLAELQAELLAEADVPWFRNGMYGERAVLDRVFRGLEDGSIPAEHWCTYAGIQKPETKDFAAFRAYRAFIPGDHAKCLEITSRYLEAAKLPPHEQIAAIKAVPIPPGPPDEFRYILTRLLVPACEKIAEAGLRTRAVLLTAATCIACERFRLKNKRWPHDLAELTPTYLPALPLNPFDGKAITYRVFADRVVVYCFWVNPPMRLDDLPLDFREPNRPGYGIGFRMWNPNQRALPPENNAP